MTIDQPEQALGRFVKDLGLPADWFKLWQPYWLMPDSRPAPAWLEVDRTWPDQYPGADNAGVYFLYSESGELRYVGKADVLGARLSNYFKYKIAGDKKSGSAQKQDWPERICFLRTISIEHENVGYLNAALESLTITLFNPPENTIGKRG